MYFVLAHKCYVWEPDTVKLCPEKKINKFGPINKEEIYTRIYIIQILHITFHAKQK